MDNGLLLFPLTVTRAFEIQNLDETREQELFARLRSSGSAADHHSTLTELWMSHAKLVIAIATRCRRSEIDLGDLINAGHLGLYTAIMRFDAIRFKTRLSSYASIWILRCIKDYIRRNAGPLRLPESKAYRQLAQCGSRLIEEARKDCERNSVDPSNTAINQRIGWRIGLSTEDVAYGLRLINGARESLYTYDEDGENELYLPDESAPTADGMDERMDHDRLRIRVRCLANEILGERERIVFLARSMAVSDAVPSLEEFAGRFEVSIARIHQIEGSARRKIASALNLAGYIECTDEGVRTRLSQVRARRGVGVTEGRFSNEAA
jgi:RNA polymerase sigma-32 factor